MKLQLKCRRGKFSSANSCGGVNNFSVVGVEKGDGGSVAAVGLDADGAAVRNGAEVGSVEAEGYVGSSELFIVIGGIKEAGEGVIAEISEASLISIERIRTRTIG